MLDDSAPAAASAPAAVSAPSVPISEWPSFGDRPDTQNELTRAMAEFSRRGFKIDHLIHQQATQLAHHEPG